MLSNDSAWFDSVTHAPRGRKKARRNAPFCEHSVAVIIDTYDVDSASTEE